MFAFLRAPSGSSAVWQVFANRATFRPETECPESFGFTVRALIRGLRDPSAEVRRRMARHLGRLGPLARAARGALLAARADPDVNVRKAAARALRDITTSVTPAPRGGKWGRFVQSLRRALAALST